MQVRGDTSRIHALGSSFIVLGHPDVSNFSAMLWQDQDNLSSMSQCILLFIFTDDWMITQLTVVVKCFGCISCYITETEIFKGP